MKDYQTATVERIREQYVERQPTKFEALRELDARVKRPAEAFAYAFGSVGALVLGTGMCLAMKVIGNMMPLGIVVGVIGIGMVSVTYSLYQGVLRARKKKYSKQIFELSDSMLGE